MTSGHPRVKRRPAKADKPTREIRQRAEIKRILLRYKRAEERPDLPPFALRNMRPEVRREFHEADRLGRAKPV